ncbi:MAG: hypothetical protein ACYDCJ_12905 [Gammaproteobacteria bacterium]
MRATLGKWCHDMVFANDGTLDLSRVLMAFAMLAFVGQSIWAMAKGQPFDWQSFGIGAGAVMGGSGLGVKWHGEAS